MSMMKFYYNIYYRFYCLIRYFGEKEIPRYNAVLFLSLFTIINFLTVVMGITMLSKKIIIVDLPRIYLFFLGLLGIGANAYMVFAGKKYLMVEKKYQDEDRRSRIKNNLYAVLYVVLTILFFALALIYFNFHPIVETP